jgi:hypothetical protein
MFAGLVLLIILTMKLFPDLPVSRQLHRGLVEVPLRRLAAMTRAHLIFGLVALAMLFTASELIMMLGSADFVMLIAWDVSLYVDAVIAGWTIAAVTRSKAAWQVLAAMVARPLRTARRRAPQRQRSPAREAANDSDDHISRWPNARAA